MRPRTHPADSLETQALLLPTDVPAHVKLELDGVVKQSKASDAKVALLPVGLGGKAGPIRPVFRRADHCQRGVARRAAGQ